MTFTEWAPPDPDRTPEVADCVAMLPDLHAALAGYPGELPLLAPVHEDVPYGLAALERRPDVLRPPERNRLLAAHQRLTPFAGRAGGHHDGAARRPQPPGASTPNTSGGWAEGPRLTAASCTPATCTLPEATCAGSTSKTSAAARWATTSRCCGGWDPTAGDGWVDAEQLTLCSDLRAVYLALCLYAFRDVFGDDPEWDGYIRWFVQQIHS